MDDICCNDFFAHPSSALHRRFEALRAVFLDHRPLVLLCQLGRYPLWHAHEFTQQQLLGRFEPEPVADLAMYLRQ